eukprot:jgi/Mesen1/9538/ME000064S08885
MAAATASLCSFQQAVLVEGAIRQQLSGQHLLANGAARVVRRDILAAGAALMASAPLLRDEAMAATYVPKGYAVQTDQVDNYAFIYPFGWQEVSVKGQDICFKDIIEPLESVSVTIINTDKGSLAELGSPEEVATALVDRVLTSGNQNAKVLRAEERETDGKKYYTFEFVSKAPNYTRHALGTIAIAYGKFYTLTIGSNERRWSKMENKVRTVANSFITL